MRTQERKKRADKDERERWDAKKEAEIRVGFVQRHLTQGLVSLALTRPALLGL
jgi:hypothetical protein